MRGVLPDDLPQDYREENVVRVLSTETKGGKPGAKEALEAYLTGISADLRNLPPTPLYAASLVLIGRVDALRAAVVQSRKAGSVPYNGRPIVWFLTMAEARLALAEGRIDDAMELFEETHVRGGPALTVGAITEVANAWAEQRRFGTCDQYARGGDPG